MEEEDSMICGHVYSDVIVQYDRPSTARYQPPFAAPQFHIRLKFSCNLFLSDWVIPLDSAQPQLLSRANASPIETFILLTLRQFLRKARKIIGRGLNYWPVESEARQRLVNFALAKTREAILSTTASHNLVHLDIRVDAVRRRVFDERRVLSWMARRSMEEDETRMVPALDSSIESLESRNTVMDSGMTCSVCLEEFGGCEAVCMPCSHVFHGDCIKKWLRISHYCAVCRFEMPTSD